MEIDQFFNVILVFRGVLENLYQWIHMFFVGFYYPAFQNVRGSYDFFIVCACGHAYEFFCTVCLSMGSFQGTLLFVLIN